MVTWCADYGDFKIILAADTKDFAIKKLRNVNAKYLTIQQV